VVHLQPLLEGYDESDDLLPVELVASADAPVVASLL